MPNGAASALSSVVKLKALNGTVDITLLLCHNDDFKTINQDICISKYETFKKAHDKCVSDIKASGHKVCNSGI